MEGKDLFFAESISSILQGVLRIRKKKTKWFKSDMKLQAIRLRLINMSSDFRLQGGGATLILPFATPLMPLLSRVCFGEHPTVSLISWLTFFCPAEWFTVQ